MMRLPKTSERGAKIIGPTDMSAHLSDMIEKRKERNSPTPKPTTNTEMGTRAASWLTLKDWETPGISAVMTLELKATTKHVTATTMVMYHFCTLDQFFGFSGSPSAKAT